jgi:hypothetical protein
MKPGLTKQFLILAPVGNRLNNRFASPTSTCVVELQIIDAVSSPAVTACERGDKQYERGSPPWLKQELSAILQTLPAHQRLSKGCFVNCGRSGKRV